MNSLRKFPLMIALVVFGFALLLEFAAACKSMGATGLAFFDLLVLMTIFLIAAPLVFTNAVVGRTQGLVTFICAIFILILALIGVLASIALLYTMMSAMSFPPSYLAVFARFPVSDVAPFLAFAMLLKFAFCGLMLLAQQKFIENRGLVIIVAMSLGGSALLGFLHAMPRIIVYVTDDIGAIILFIVVLIRAIGFIRGSLPAMKKAAGI
jgi:hypothetical protein